MSTFKLTLEPYAGSSVERACADAQSVADKLNVNAAFSFNNVACLAIPGGAAGELLRQWEEQIKRKDADLAPLEKRFARSIP